MNIVQILSVVDTREFEEINDRFVAMPGTGTVNQCARCNKGHEIHATVRLDNGDQAVVGVGCMKSDSAELVGKVKKLATNATKHKQLESKLAKLEAALLKFDYAKFKVNAMIPPEPEYIGGDGKIWKQGDAQVWTVNSDGQFGAERRACLLQSWKDKRLSDFGFHYYDGTRLNDQIITIRKRLKRLEK